MSDKMREEFEAWLPRKLIKDGIDIELMPVYLKRISTGQYLCTRTDREWAAWLLLASANRTIRGMQP